MLLLLICAQIAVRWTTASQVAEVRVEQGLLGGVVEQFDGVPFAAFRGVPYAQAPVGELRFEAPRAPSAWPGLRNATAHGAPCLQWTRDGEVVGAEDCLYLNVFAPLPLDGERRDVVFFVHGGAFMYGSGALVQPDFLVPRGVVLVSLNYRLGLLGFLSTGDDAVPGNNGLKDQQAALLWVRANIGAFGGDPERVTIAGLSAGGASVHYHMVAPGSRGLFRAGISLSGSATCRWAQADRLPEKTRTLAEMFECPTPDDSRAVAECLRTKDGHQLVAATEMFMLWRANPFSPWAPSVEPSSPDAFLSETPDAVLRRGAGAPVPWLVGVTSHEGLYPVAEFIDDADAVGQLGVGWDWLAPALLDLAGAAATPEDAVLAARAARAKYLPGGRVDAGTMDQLVQMVGDRHFVAELERSARLQAATSPVFLYRFSYRGARSFSEAMSGSPRDLGASHGDDLAYILRSPFADSRTTAQDQAMSDLLIGMWTSFAASGVPVVESVSWPRVSAEDADVAYLEVASPSAVRVASAKELGQRAFWDGLRIASPQVSKSRVLRDEL